MLCPECNQPVLSMCEECGIFFDKPELIVYDLHNYTSIPQRCYKREDRFKEVLAQFHGKEGEYITAETSSIIKAEMPDITKITVEDVKQVLRKLRMTKYVENARGITFALTGQEPPHIKREIEDKMSRMFKQIVKAYTTINKESGKSSMSYHYIIYKLLELMGQSELLPRVPMIKTTFRIRQIDTRWERICQELSWTFKPTCDTEDNPPQKHRRADHKTRAPHRHEKTSPDE
jgi:hypothetical protein